MFGVPSDRAAFSRPKRRRRIWPASCERAVQTLTACGRRRQVIALPPLVTSAAGVVVNEPLVPTRYWKGDGGSRHSARFCPVKKGPRSMSLVRAWTWPRGHRGAGAFCCCLADLFVEVRGGGGGWAAAVGGRGGVVASSEHRAYAAPVGESGRREGCADREEPGGHLATLPGLPTVTGGVSPVRAMASLSWPPVLRRVAISARSWARCGRRGRCPSFRRSWRRTSWRRPGRPRLSPLPR